MPRTYFPFIVTSHPQLLPQHYKLFRISLPAVVPNIVELNYPRAHFPMFPEDPVKRLLRLFRLNTTTSKPEARLRHGALPVLEILAPHGFRFVFRKSGNSSGGLFASGEFVRGNRRLEIHVRESLGLVRYHLGEHSASHEFYMKELGVFPQCQYPGFPNDPLDPFIRLAHDVAMAGEFIHGDARLLLQASAREKTALMEQNERDAQRYSGDVQTLQKMRDAFRCSDYEQVVQLSSTLKSLEKMTLTQRRMLEVAKSKITLKG